MKKYFIIALAALGFAACAEKMNDGPSPEQTGELEQSYIAINLMSSDLDTRAEDQAPTLGDGDLSDGIEGEHAVNTVHFFFFRQGAPFAVNAFPGTSPGGTRNWQQATNVTFDNDLDNDNISKYSNVVLVLNNYKGQYPDQVVAVLNWNPKEQFYTLDQLRETLSDLQENGNGFVMSNSVYRSGEGKVINATDIPGTYETEAEARADDHVVDIYVERIAAKVTVNTPTANIDGKWDATNKWFDTGKTSNLTTLGESQNKVYVKIQNWSLYNARTKSNLIKSINPAWTDDALGLNWNDSPRFRSYWAAADTYAGTADDYINKNVFNWENGTDLGGALYCGENTAPLAEDRTKLILKGQLVDADNKALELVKWNGQEMVKVENLKKAVAAQLQYLVYSYTDKDDATTYTSITDADIECISGANAESLSGVEDYEVYFQLTTTATTTKSWAIKTGDKWETKDAAHINAYLIEHIPAAIVYKSGQTYYYIDIKHLGTSDKDAEYGIVRNHIYDIEIQSIKGYGTPVFIPGGNIVVPETPTEEEGVYVAAKINVLSWRVVKQGVNIEVQ
jgi:hypothetical protein